MDKPTAATLACAALLMLGALAGEAGAEAAWRGELRASGAARDSGNFSLAREHLLRVRDELGETPGLSYQLARLDARLGDREGALRGLGLYANSGLSRDAFGDPDFAALASDSAFTALAARIRANAEPVQKAELLHTMSDAGLLAEDVAYDPAGKRWFVTSIVRGEVIEVDAKGRERVFAVSPHERRRGFFAAAVDAPRRLLWVSEVNTPTSASWEPTDAGHSALLAFSLADGRLVRRIEVPMDGPSRTVGDLCVAGDGTVYATDGATGAVFRLRPGARSLGTLVAAGRLQSPQQPALSPDGRLLYVPDYSRGIAVVTLASGRLDWLGFEPGNALQGIDGLIAVPRALLAVQNGVRPRRVMRFELDGTGRRVVRGTPIESGTARLGEPTHGVISGGAYVFIGNSGWERVNEKLDMVTGPEATRPLLLRMPLAGMAPARPGENP